MDGHGSSVRGELVERLRLLAWSVGATVLAVLSLALFLLAVLSVPLIAVWVGLPIVYGVLLVVRPVADVYRRRAGELLDVAVGSPYLARVPGGPWVRLRSLLRDPATWRDFAWLTVNATAGLVMSAAALLEAVPDLLFWWLPKGLLLRTQATLATALLAPNDRTELARQVQRLTLSRAETVDVSAAELRRIERDLHDGAQARLVALGMTLGMAESELDRDAGAARDLLVEARNASASALSELRDLVRGIHPPVLADRGLVGAVQALTLTSPVPVEVEAELRDRLPAPVESAAYFAVAEALTNVLKHSGATRAAVRIRQGDELAVEVRDDGVGGADPANGSGLRGIERRLSAFDGTLTVSSPVGGPTVLAMVLPCASFLPKTSPSSGTG